MDLRIVKTRKAIREAFLQLRMKTPLERIKVKDLCDLALINKTTFYKHHMDIYALNEELEKEAMEKLMSSFEARDALFSDPESFLLGLPIAIDECQDLLEPLFSGRKDVFFGKLEQTIKDRYLSHAKSESEVINTIFLIGGLLRTVQELRLEKKQDIERLVEQLILIIRSMPVD